KQKPIIPLVFPKATVPILINHLTWIPFFDGDELHYDDGFQELLNRIRQAPKSVAVQQDADDPFREYLVQLYEWIVSYLDKSVFSLITLASTAVADAVAPADADNQVLPNVFLNTFALSAGIADAPKAPSASDSYRSFPEAFEAYEGRVLL